MKCPVCEHEQDFGFECEVCGREVAGLDGLGPPPMQEERVEGLEQTQLSVEPGAIPLPVMADLERTELERADNVSVSALDDMETTRAAPMDVTVEKMGDMTDDRAPDDGVRTVLQPGAVTCRYCRNVQASGAVCERCGMALPKYVAEPSAVKPKVVSAVTRCKSCGAPGLAGARCGECGRTIAADS